MANITYVGTRFNTRKVYGEYTMAFVSDYIVEYDTGTTRTYKIERLPKKAVAWMEENAPESMKYYREEMREYNKATNPFGMEACMDSVAFHVETLEEDPFDLLADFEQRAEEDVYFNKTMIDAVKQYIEEKGLTQEEEKGAKEMTREERRNMIKAIEENTKAVIDAYQENDKPSETVEMLVDSMGYEKAVVAVAIVVNRVSIHDGRIYDGVREWAKSIEDAPSHEVMESLNIYGVDSWIHSAHVDQIGDAMRKYEPPTDPFEEERKTREEREQFIMDLMADALRISGKNADNWSRTKEQAIWEKCGEWNDEHDPEHAVFMCEQAKNSGDEFTGFYIEDDYFITEPEEPEDYPELEPTEDEQTEPKYQNDTITLNHPSLGEVLEQIDTGEKNIYIYEGCGYENEIGSFRDGNFMPQDDARIGMDFDVVAVTSDEDFYYVHIAEGSADEMTTTCDISKEIKDALEPDALTDIGYICDYGETEYISDVFSYWADNETSIYYSDIIKYISEHVEEVNDAIEEFGWDGCGSDLYKAGQMAEYLEINNWLWSHDLDIYKVYALDYYRHNYGEKIHRWMWEQINEAIEEYYSDIQINTLGEITQIVDDAIHAMCEALEERKKA